LAMTESSIVIFSVPVQFLRMSLRTPEGPISPW
jgi:hypothetical protein